LIRKITMNSPDANAMFVLIRALYPICRSITGDGVRATLARLAQDLPLQIHEVPSGTQALDWTVPREWNIRDAYVKNAAGQRVIDFQQHNLHVVNYSAPFRGTLALSALRPRLHSLPDRPDAIPYRTSYYKEDWGFCLSHNALQALPEGDYEVCIDATLVPGALTYAECVIPGADPSAGEVLLSTHICHPSLANDNLSGIAIAWALAQALRAWRDLRHTYRFVFVPGTIGAIVWLSRNMDAAARVRHGLVLTGMGDPAPLRYKQTRRGDTLIDRAAAHVLAHASPAGAIDAFSPYGYDERQYNSPGFDLPVGALGRARYASYPQYHTSDDDLAFVRPAQLDAALAAVLQIVDILERDAVCVNMKPHGEPQLGKRGLYGALGGAGDAQAFQMALLWVLNQSDGTRSLLDIATRANMPFATIRAAADALLKTDLLREEPAR
jgi:aminopeptidase-like protein